MIRTARASEVTEAYAAFGLHPDELDIGVRYSRARMYSTPTPLTMYPPGVTTSAAAQLAVLPPGRRAILELRNEDYFLMRFGDAEYVRQYILNMPGSDRVAGFVWGSNGYQYGREFVSTEPEMPRQLMIRKMWYSFLLTGRLGYDPTLSPEYLRKVLAHRFPGADPARLDACWSASSRIFPLLNRFVLQGGIDDYCWYPEACYGNTERTAKGFISIDTLITKMTPVEPGIQGIATYVASRARAGDPGGKLTPPDVARQLASFAADALAGAAGLPPGNDKELRLTLGDITAMAHLGNYYAEKILGATEKALAEKLPQDSATHRSAAIVHLQAAAQHWRRYAAESRRQYQPQVFSKMGGGVIDLKRIFTDVLQDLVLIGGTAPMGSIQPTSGGLIREAEDAVADSGRAAVQGFTGTGYVEAAGPIRWTYTLSQAGSYRLEIRYRLVTGEVPGTLTINNGEPDRTLSFWTTGDSWQAETRLVAMKEGANVIELAVTGPSVAIDHINLVHHVD